MTSLKDLPLEGKKVLVRVDYNVPLGPEGILDNSRIVASLPTLHYLLSLNCKIILMSHLGRPKGKPTSEFSLKPVAVELSRLLRTNVKLAPDVIGQEVKDLIEVLNPGEILMLENLRFYEAEEDPSKDANFSKELAGLADFYIDDAFGCAHRSHASIVEVPKLLKGKSAPGLLLENEIQFLGSIISNPKKPFLALIGGAKISTKIGVIQALIEKVDCLAVGGGMAFTFLKAQGIEIGNSLVEDKFIPQAQEIISKCQSKHIPLILPIDVVICDEIRPNVDHKVQMISNGIPKGFQGVDIGPSTIQLFKNAMQKAQTILWNGPMGIFEIPPFDKGTLAIAQVFAESNAMTIAGGGETVAALSPYKEKVKHISTGGGATLEFLELGTLPGIDILKK